jgi:hypothetical protein
MSGTEKKNQKNLLKLRVFDKTQAQLVKSEKNGELLITETCNKIQDLMILSFKVKAKAVD